MLPRYDAMGASSRLRMLQYVPALEAQGISINVKPLLDDGYVSDLYAGRISPTKVAAAYLRRARHLLRANRFDVIWLEKEVWPWLPAPFEGLCLPRSTALVADYDDAVFHRYDQHSSTIVRRLLGKKIDTLMRRADLITAGNDYLAARARQAGAARVEWLPTVIDLERYPLPPQARSNETVTIGWIGSPATAHYLHEVIPMLGALAESWSIRCVAIGARPDQVQGTPFECWRWDESTEVGLLRQLDIGIMPLPDAPWERGKCGYKLIQYMACGLPVVASPVGVNVDIVQTGENGELAGSSADWQQALTRLVESPALRHRMGAAGRRRVEAIYSVQAQAGRLADLLQSTRPRNGH